MEKKNKSFSKDRNNNGRRRADSFREEVREEINECLVSGRNAVRELLKSDRAIDKIYVKKGDSREGSITVLVAEAVSKGIP